METSNVIIQLVLGTILLLLAIVDIKYREIPNMWLMLTGVAVLVLTLLKSLLFHQSFSLLSAVGGVIIGLILIIISKITREKVGIGDGITLCITGFSLGIWANLQILMYALFLSAIYAVYLLVFRRVNKEHTIPFIPFIFAGYIGVICL
jgi:leader peptidase (prepilin peptidase)/N-methyltransferase